MQPPFQDPTNPTGQPSFQDPTNPTGQPSFQDPVSSTGQPPFYPQSGPLSTPPPPPVLANGIYPGEEGHYNQFSQPGSQATQYGSGSQQNLYTPVKPPRNPWKGVSLFLLILVLILGTATATLFLTRSNSPAQQIGHTTAVPATQGPAGATTVPATQPPTGATATAPVSATGTPTAITGSSNNYSAPEPGPGCDTNGGVWTPQGIGNISCGTQVTPTADGTWGYLYLQLPGNQPIASNNEITITGSSIQGSDCIGLAEQDANTGFLAAYCANGAWSISSISNKGIITKSLLNNISATRTSTTISLALTGDTLTFTIDTETHQLTISPLQPIKVAIAYDIDSNCTTCYIPSIATNNFSYITPAG